MSEVTTWSTAHLAPCAVDQTLGVECLNCDVLLCWCWADEHVPESAWNRACENDPDGVPCEQDRVDRCALCGEACALTKK